MVQKNPQAQFCAIGGHSRWTQKLATSHACVKDVPARTITLLLEGLQVFSRRATSGVNELQTHLNCTTPKFTLFIIIVPLFGYVVQCWCSMSVLIMTTIRTINLVLTVVIFGISFIILSEVVNIEICCFATIVDNEGCCRHAGQLTMRISRK